MPDPYLPLLDDSLDLLLPLDPLQAARQRDGAVMVHWDQENEWVWTHLAGYGMLAAYLWQHPQSRWHHAERVSEYLRHVLRLLVEAAVDDRWWHLDGRKGDPNIDRFTLLPVMESLQFARDALDPQLLSDLRSKIAAVLRVQYEEYGKPKNDAEPYPNMDVYYCLIMLLGSGMTDRAGGSGAIHRAHESGAGADEPARYEAEFERFLRIMQAAQFEGGGWTYFRGTNECPVYHDINVSLMGRIYNLTDDERALEMVHRSVPYYPHVVDPTGRPEYYTDPWWKHSWTPQGSPAVDIVASLAHDEANRAIADLLRPTTARESDVFNGQVFLPETVYASLLWEDGLTPTPLPRSSGEGEQRRGITFDPSIEGPRGRFERWSWAATARYGSDTLVGAVAHTGERGRSPYADRPPVALMAIAPEIPWAPPDTIEDGLQRYGLAVTPAGTRGQTLITAEAAEFTAEYPMACFRHVWGHEPYPLRWRCRQHWRMDEGSLTGEIEVISEADQDSPPPLVHIRFGRDLTMAAVDVDDYRCGPFVLIVHSDDFPHRTIRPCRSVSYMVAEDAVELLLSAGAPAAHVVDQTYRLSLRINFEE